MRWRRGRRSANVEDRRGFGTRVATRIPAGMRFPRGGIPRGGGGIGRAGLGGGIGLVVLVLAMLFFGLDPGVLFQDAPTGGAPGYYETAPPAPPSPAEEEMADFVSAVLADTEDTWRDLFARTDGAYQEPTLVLFTGATESACGLGQAASGPF